MTVGIVIADARRMYFWPCTALLDLVIAHHKARGWGILLTNKGFFIPSFHYTLNTVLPARPVN